MQLITSQLSSFGGVAIKTLVFFPLFFPPTAAMSLCDGSARLAEGAARQMWHRLGWIGCQCFCRPSTCSNRLQSDPKCHRRASPGFHHPLQVFFFFWTLTCLRFSSRSLYPARVGTLKIFSSSRSFRDLFCERVRAHTLIHLRSLSPVLLSDDSICQLSCCMRLSLFFLSQSQIAAAPTPSVSWCFESVCVCGCVGVHPPV